MKVKKVPAVFLLSLALASPLALLARGDGDNRVALPTAPTADQATTSKLVYGLLSDSRYAYRPRALDETLSADIFKRYLEALDGGKQFFTAADVAKFAPLKAQMGEAVRSGELDPAYDVFTIYRQRVQQRVAYARSLLKQDFDFSGDQRWEYDRKDAPWAASTEELDALWKKSVMNDWLRLKLAGKKPEDIRKTLDKRYANLQRTVDEFKSEDVFQAFLTATPARSTRTPITSPRAPPRTSTSRCRCRWKASARCCSGRTIWWRSARSCPAARRI